LGKDLLSASRGRSSQSYIAVERENEVNNRDPDGKHAELTPSLSSFLPPFFSSLLSLSLSSSGVSTQGLTFVREVFYHLSHAPRPFCF
jgi:hypothetical protein